MKIMEKERKHFKTFLILNVCLCKAKIMQKISNNMQRPHIIIKKTKIYIHPPNILAHK